MADYKLRIQRFRTNDLLNDKGKQFEIGASWCKDFFGIPSDEREPSFTLTFKALNNSQSDINDIKIELKLSAVNTRGDRKAYSNNAAGISQIKDLFINKLHLRVPENQEDYFAIYKIDDNNYNIYYIPRLLHDNFIQLFEHGKLDIKDISIQRNEYSFKDLSLQQIFYGAPGTGKSHEIKEILKDTKSDYIRTTFHPDSDYSTFVGAYKPTMKSFPVTTVIDTKAVDVVDEEGHKMTEEKIVYEFVPQAFLQAYVAAWKKYGETDSMADGKPQSEFLVIEEINRGNCAQIFGDLFQLLDRGDSGFSEYYITADSDMQKYLRGQFKDLDLSAVEGTLNSLFESENVAERIKDGSILLLPNNLYIWATMNTSDQSLFPIDSAFKRRWDWKYMPIADAEQGFVISNNGSNYDWWQFLEVINKHIFDATQSEDKKMGYFFCKPKGKEIDAEMFVGKVVFYLWNDVFKDTEFSDGIFNDGENGKLTFDKFYTADGTKTEIASDKVEVFLKNLGLEPSASQNGTNDAENKSADSKNNDKFKFKVNDTVVYTLKSLAETCVKEYIKLNPDKTAQEVYDVWKEYKGNGGGNRFIETQQEYDKHKANDKNIYAAEVDCHGEKLYVSTEKFHITNEDIFMDWVNKQDWGIVVTKVPAESKENN